MASEQCPRPGDHVELEIAHDFLTALSVPLCLHQDDHTRDPLRERLAWHVDGATEPLAVDVVAAVRDLADALHHDNALAENCPGCKVQARHASTIQACRENQ